MTLTKEQMLAGAGVQIEQVDLSKEIGEGSVTYVKGLTADERDDYETSIIKVGKDGAPMLDKLSGMQARSKLIVKCQCDENGVRVWEDTDADAVGALSGKIVTKIFVKAQRLSGLSLDDMKEITKN